VNHDEIIAMAKEAGFQDGWLNLWSANFEKFAALVAERKRDACVQVCLDKSLRYMEEGKSGPWHGAVECGHAIRFPGNKVDA
jgi:hypothetical protein